MIIVVYGLPGSGKSYFAKKLSEQLQADYVNSDVLRHEQKALGKYSAEDKLQIYELMADQMTKAIECQKDIVLDATFYQAHIRDKFIKLATELKSKVCFIEIWAKDEIIRKRLSKKREFSEADYSVHRIVKERFEPYSGDQLRLESGEDNIDQMLERGVAYVKDNHD